MSQRWRYWRFQPRVYFSIIVSLFVMSYSFCATFLVHLPLNQIHQFEYDKNKFETVHALPRKLSESPTINIPTFDNNDRLNIPTFDNNDRRINFTNADKHPNRGIKQFDANRYEYDQPKIHGGNITDGTIAKTADMKITNDKLSESKITYLKTTATNRECPNGKFALSGTSGCQRLLSCRDISRIRFVKWLNGGFVKEVFMGAWKGQLVAVNRPSYHLLFDHFKNGQDMHRQLGNGIHATKVLGYCNITNTYVTGYFKFGDGRRILDLLAAFDMDNIVTRFSLCIDYVAILKYLHNSPNGAIVNCDSNTLPKTLSQLLVTDDLHLILNDLDDMPLVRRNGVWVDKSIHCGKEEIIRDLDFVAPEELWPYNEEVYNYNEMPGYDEKTDIWKIPNVCEHFLGDGDEGKKVVSQLFRIHRKCKYIQSCNRPSAAQVLDEYLKVWYENGYHNTTLPGRLKLVEI